MKRKNGFNLSLLLLLFLTLAGLLFLRFLAKAPAAPTAAEAETPPPAATLEVSTPEPTREAAPSPTPAPTSSPFEAPRGYTEETYQLVSDMVYAYADRQEEAAEIIRSDLKQLGALDPALGSLWGKIMDYWAYVNGDLELHPGILPDGLPDDDSLCIVALGFQLYPDGSMHEELRGRCETVLRCAQKYPHALIALTGGGTAWQNPSATEAGVMADWLAEHGVSRDRMILEELSHTTSDNAAYTCATLRAYYPQVKSLAVVSSDYHLPLGMLLFQEQAYLYEYETGLLPFSVISCAALDTEGRSFPDSPMSQRLYLWSLADPKY